MGSFSAVIKGIIRGKTIELESAPGLPDGQSVAVMVQPVEHKGKLPAGDGIRRSAGAWSDDPEGLEYYLEQVRQAREQDRTAIEP